MPILISLNLSTTNTNILVCVYGDIMRKSLYVRLTNAEQQVAADRQTKPFNFNMSLSVGCYHLHPPTPFSVTQPIVHGVMLFKFVPT